MIRDDKPEPYPMSASPVSPAVSLPPLVVRGTTRLLGLLGDPVGHSLSPAMHNAALSTIGCDAVYLALPVKPENLEAAIDGLRAVNFLGANVTLPHKATVAALFRARGYELSPLARALGVVNTIVHREDGTLYGDTTDAAGFIAAFEDAHGSFDGRAVAILGNGGSARTIATGLPMMRAVTRITVVARNLAKAEALVTEVRAALRHPAHQAVAPDVAVTAVSFADYPAFAGRHDVVVNTTSVGMHPDVEATPLPAEALTPGQIVYDIIYNPLETRLLREARTRGCDVLNGLGMLVHQGKVAFELWMTAVGRPDAVVPAEVFHAGIRRQFPRNGEGP
jgi:shikimate dehydrogenase